MWNGMHTKTYNLDDLNYNKIPVYNSLCCFATRVIYTQISVTWDEGI